MVVFGWIMAIILILFALFVLVVFTIPFIVTETKMMSEKIKRAIDDKRFDLDERSKARRHRDELKRQKDFELANKKLDAKLRKVDKQIELHEKKLSLAKSYKEHKVEEKEELNKEAPISTRKSRFIKKEDVLKIEETNNVPKNATLVDEVVLIDPDSKSEQEIENEILVKENE